MKPALAIRARRLGYRGVAPASTVLADLDLRIATGERVALVGGNGAGKTTLLRALVGLLPVEAGEVSAGGDRIISPADAVAAGIGLVFQSPDDQLFGATVIEDVSFGPRNQGLGEAEVSRRAGEALEALGLATLAARPIESLSFGEKKRACIAGVLAMRPSVLLLDEPTAGLDPAGELGFIELLATLARERRITVVLATHAIDLVPYLAHRVLLLGDGRVLADGTVAEVFACSEALASARLRLPLVTRLARDLAHAGLPIPQPLPLTVEEAKARWTAHLS